MKSIFCFGAFFFFLYNIWIHWPFFKSQEIRENVLRKTPYGKFLLSRHCELYPKGKLTILLQIMVFWLQNIISSVAFSSPALRPLVLQRRTAHLPLGAALHDLQEEVDCLQTLVASLTARYPHLPFPDFGQREVRNYPFLRQHLLQNFKPWGKKNSNSCYFSRDLFCSYTQFSPCIKYCFGK